MDKIDGLVKIVCDKYSNHEHIDINECRDNVRPKLAIYKDSVIPPEAKDGLQESHTLNHVYDHKLEICQSEFEIDASELVNEHKDRKNDSKYSHPIVESTHYSDIVNNIDRGIDYILVLF